VAVRLTKEQSQKRWNEVRDLWCAWDPIGVMSMLDWPRDEYDAYLGPTLRMLESGASLQEISAYLEWAELDHMGLSDNEQARSHRLVFAAKLREWYQKHWADSCA
jgi:hypothetical protein